MIILNIITAAAAIDTTTAAIVSSVVTIALGYFKYKTAITKVKCEAETLSETRTELKKEELVAEAKGIQEERNKNFKDQLEQQKKTFESMLANQQKAFQKQLEALRKEKTELSNKIATLEETVDEKIEQIIDLASQNSRREGMLEIMKNGNTTT